jgi:hypothetical protein
VSRWDLPLLLKYKIRRFPSHTPYFSGGLNTNYIVNTTQISEKGFIPSGGGPIFLAPVAKIRNPPAELKYRSSEGFVVSGGLEFRYYRVRVAPELRYTRWAHENFRELFSVGKLRSNLDQAEVLVTLGW